MEQISPRIQRECAENSVLMIEENRYRHLDRHLSLAATVTALQRLFTLSQISIFGDKVSSVFRIPH